ncbi:hypothetical protein KSP40_PGU014354 [Platanthera guangdongensis]|uniref:B box-type domain-containing protein n=1 Tax=Platanthera guangdongensis TaxID=2320717 RepID=A0ABR2LUY8_9ASPA
MTSLACCTTFNAKVDLQLPNPSGLNAQRVVGRRDRKTFGTQSKELVVEEAMDIRPVEVAEEIVNKISEEGVEENVTTLAPNEEETAPKYQVPQGGYNPQKFDVVDSAAREDLSPVHQPSPISNEGTSTNQMSRTFLAQLKGLLDDQRKQLENFVDDSIKNLRNDLSTEIKSIRFKDKFIELNTLHNALMENQNILTGNLLSIHNAEETQLEKHKIILEINSRQVTAIDDSVEKSTSLHEDGSGINNGSSSNQEEFTDEQVTAKVTSTDAKISKMVEELISVDPLFISPEKVSNAQPSSSTAKTPEQIVDVPLSPEYVEWRVYLTKGNVVLHIFKDSVLERNIAQNSEYESAARKKKSDVTFDGRSTQGEKLFQPRRRIEWRNIMQRISQSFVCKRRGFRDDLAEEMSTKKHCSGLFLDVCEEGSCCEALCRETQQLEEHLQCDVCGAEEASVLDCADEAVLCIGCDARIHLANKLAEKHRSFSLQLRRRVHGARIESISL